MNQTIGGLADHDPVTLQAAVSGALATVFRGKFCDVVLPNRKAATFTRNAVIYDVGDRDRTFFFLQSGFVKIGTITPDGHEVIYDIRKAATLLENCALASIPAQTGLLRWSKRKPFPFRITKC